MSAVWSRTIDNLRFPMAIMVVFIHLCPPVENIYSYEIFSGESFLNLVYISLSQIFCRVAVPTFFFISGFLFFLNLNDWSWSGYRKKLKNRMKTLLIPYILWNILALSFSVIRAFFIEGMSIIETLHYFLSIGIRIFIDCVPLDDYHNILGYIIHLSGPINGPLWFLRDLILVSFFSPLIYFFVKKSGLCVVLFLFIAYVSQIWTDLPGFSVSAIFFFSLGAYFTLYSIDIVYFTRRYLLVSFSVSIVLFISSVVTWGNGEIYSVSILNCYTFVSLFLLLGLSSYMVEKYNVRWNSLFINSCFFIYAAHNMPILIKWTPIWFAHNSVHRFLPDESIIGQLICYLLSPLFAVFICFMLYIALKMISPKVCILLGCGRK